MKCNSRYVFAGYIGSILSQTSENGNSPSLSIPHRRHENLLLSSRTGIRAAWEARLEP